MFTVSLIGPDGVGKTTIATRLEADFPMPVKYIYMGMNPEASNYMLPTTRWWENRKGRQKGKERSETDAVIYAGTAKSDKKKTSYIQKTKFMLRKSIGFVNRVAEESYRYLVATIFVKRGYIVLYDRHYVYDYYHENVNADKRNSSNKRKMHGFFLKHLLPEPDFVICLDAPGEVVFQRKGEFTPEFMELRRNQYLSLKSVITNFSIVDANRDLEVVVHDVSKEIMNFHQRWQSSGKR